MKLKKNVSLIDSSLYNLLRKRKLVDRRYRRKVFLVKYLPIVGFFFFGSAGLWNFLFMLVWWFGVTIFYDHRDIQNISPNLRVWFGIPGSGKTSVAAWLTRNSIKYDLKVLSNVPIKGSFKLEHSDLGKYDMSFGGAGCHTILDEATVHGLDNRGFKDFSKSTKPVYFSEYRHMLNLCDVFSQDYDVDLKIKSRAGRNSIFHLQRLGIPGFVMYRRIGKIFFIRKEDKQFVDGFKYVGLPRICYTRSVWSSFDTYDLSDCPKEQKVWELWSFEE